MKRVNYATVNDGAQINSFEIVACNHLCRPSADKSTGVTVITLSNARARSSLVEGAKGLRARFSARQIARHISFTFIGLKTVYFR